MAGMETMDTRETLIPETQVVADAPPEVTADTAPAPEASSDQKAAPDASSDQKPAPDASSEDKKPPALTPESAKLAIENYAATTHATATTRIPCGHKNCMHLHCHGVEDLHCRNEFSAQFFSMQTEAQCECRVFLHKLTMTASDKSTLSVTRLALQATG